MKFYTVYPNTENEAVISRGDFISWMASGGRSGGAKRNRLVGMVAEIIPPGVSPDAVRVVKRPYRRYRGNSDDRVRFLVAVPRWGVKGQPLRPNFYLVYTTRKSDIKLVRRGDG